MTTTNKIISFLDSFKSLNRYIFDFTLTHGSCYDEFILNFEFPVQCALLFSLIHDMLIENTSFYLESSKVIRILVVGNA